MKTIKTNFKTIIVCVIAFIFTGIFSVKAQNASEKLVTNIDEVKDFMKFKDKTPVKDPEGNGVIGFHYTESLGKGHRRSNGHCQFNRGLCGIFSAFDLTTDKEGNILPSSFQMYLGKNENGEYLRFEGIKVEDDL